LELAASSTREERGKEAILEPVDEDPG
jgi:hypothetical protein